MSKAKKQAKKPAKKVVRKPQVKSAAKPAKPAKTAAAKKAVKKAAPAKAKVAKKAARPAPEVKKVKKPLKEAPVVIKAKKPVEEKPKAKVEAKKPKVEEPVQVEEPVIEATEPEAEGEVVLTDAEGRRYCRVKDCDQAAMVEGYCRFHYLLFWKKIQVRKKILSEGKLERYVEELTSRYPDKYLEMIRKDLKTEKDFLAAIQELEIDDSGVDNEYEDEAQSFIEEVRGISSESGPREDDEF